MISAVRVGRGGGGWYTQLSVAGDGAGRGNKGAAPHPIDSTSRSSPKTFLAMTIPSIPIVRAWAEYLLVDELNRIDLTPQLRSCSFVLADGLLRAFGLSYHASQENTPQSEDNTEGWTRGMCVIGLNVESIWLRKVLSNPTLPWEDRLAGTE